MGKKMKTEIRKTLNVWWFEFRSIIFSVRWLMLSIITFLLIYFALEDLVRFAQNYDLKISPAALPFLFTDLLFVSLNMFVLIFMMSMFPIINHLQQNILIRSGNRCWANAQMLTIMTISLLWIVETQLFICIVLRNQLDFSGWGQAWGTLANNAASNYGYYTAMEVSREVITGYTPIQAVLISMLLIWLTSTIFGQIIFCVDGMSKNYLGEIILSIWSLIWLIVGNLHMLENISLIRKLSPKTWLDISRYVKNPLLFYQSLGIMLGIIVILYIINRFLIKQGIIATK